MNRSIVTTSVTLLLFFTALPGAAQSPPFPVNSYTTDGQSFPAVCADTAGNFVVVWESGSPSPDGQDGSYFGIFGRRFTPGGTPRGAEFAVNTYTTDYQTFPAIACADDGGFIVAWSSFGQDGSSSGVFGQRFSNSGAPAGTEFQVNTHTTGTQDYPAVGAAADGDFVVVWTSESQDGLGSGVFGQRFSSSGEKTGIEFRVNSYTTGDQTYPAISVRDAGAFVVTWVSEGQDGDGNGVFAQRFSATALEVGDEFPVNSTVTGDQGFPAIAMDGDGRFTIVWSSDDGDDANIVAQRFASDGSPIGGELLVNSYTTGDQLFPHISAADTGELVVVWTNYGPDGNDADVVGQRFASDGQRAGTEFQVNQSAAGVAQYSAAPAHVSGDDFVVVWARHEGGPSETDVAGRWYSAATPTPTHTATPPPTATRTATPTSSPRPSATATVPKPTETTAAQTATATVAPTEVPTSSPTETPVDTPTDTATPEPTATPTDADTPTLVPPSVTPSPGLVGDCDDDGVVAVNELVTGVNIALDRSELARCDPFDRNHDGHVNVDELVAAVREALAR